MSLAGHPSLTTETELSRLRVLYQLLEALAAARGFSEVCQAAVTSLLAATTAGRAAVLTFDGDGARQFKAWHGLSPEYRQGIESRLPWQRTDDSGIRVIPDVLLDHTTAGFQALFGEEQIRSLAFIPLKLHGRNLGELALYYPEPHECSPEELAAAQDIARHVAGAMDRASAERSRADSEQRLKAILDNSATVIFLKDLQGRYLLVNRRFEELFRVTQADVLGKTDYALFPREVADRFTEHDRKVIEGRTQSTEEERAPLPDGIHIYISVRFPVEGPDGLPAGVCGIATDITDRKRLEVSREHLAAIVESSNDAIIGESLGGLITSWNEGAKRIFGYSAEEMLGSPASLLAPPALRQEMPALLERTLRGEDIEGFETLRLRKDGEAIHVSLTFSPVLDESGAIAGASKVVRDITERKRAEQERAEFLAREQEARRTAELLNRIAPRLLASLDLEKLVHTVAEASAALLGAEFGVFVQPSADPSSGFTLMGVCSSMPREEFIRDYEPRLAGLLRSSVQPEAVTCRGAVAADPRSGGPGVRSYLTAPVVARSGEVLGALFFGHAQADRFRQSHESILTGIAALAAIAIEKARLFAEAKWAQAELQRSNQELRRVNQDLETFAYSATTCRSPCAPSPFRRSCWSAAPGKI